MLRQFELVDKVQAYNPEADEALLNSAYVFAVRAHGGQTRASGEPYLNHPVEVAGILTDLHLDDATIVTALLHDTIEDTAATHDEIAARFGEEIAALVDGVTKLSKLDLKSREHQQAENFRKLVTAMARDPRVLLVKLADRLHNMRTIGHLALEKRERIARETLEIFAPLAGRMGMQWMREELEDLSFSVLHPDARLSVMKRFLHLKREAGDHVVDDIVALLREQLDLDGVKAEVFGREKRPYSIWRKMELKEVSFEQLSDIIAFRVIVDNEADCYRALGAVHRRMAAVPGRFKDYISSPKPNGYRSLHTTIIGKRGARVEMQIRTGQMHEVAETGVAAHWSYRDGAPNENPFAVDPFSWLRDLVERLARGEPDPELFLEEAKMELRFDQVFCFTPRGDVIGLPLGATALDLAYAVHTGIGHRAVGAKVDGKPAPLWKRLRNGQTVEILTSQGQRPQPSWYDLVSTARARQAIRRELREMERDEAVIAGAKIVERAFERVGAQYSTKAMETAASRLSYSEAEALLAAIGFSEVTAVQVVEAVHPELVRAHDTHDGATVGSADPNRKKSVVTRRWIGGAVEGSTRSMPAAPCCRPLPGERIMALREPGVGFRLHAIDCEVLERYEDALDRWLDVSWNADAGVRAENLAGIVLVLANEAGALGQVCTLLGASGVNIDGIEIRDRTPEMFRIQFEIEVRDVRHLNNVLTALRAHPIVEDAYRLRGENDEPEDAALRLAPNAARHGGVVAETSGGDDATRTDA